MKLILKSNITFLVLFSLLQLKKAEENYMANSNPQKVQFQDNTYFNWVFGEHADNNNSFKVYTENADIYDAISEEIGWNSSIEGAKVLHQELLKRGLTKDQHILDIGAGTGLVGVELNKYGYYNLSALDINQNMLNEAKKKSVYSEFILLNLNSDIGIESKNYPFDHAIAIGVFFTGQTEPSNFDNFLNFVKKGGLMVFSIRKEVWDDPNCGYKRKSIELELNGKWKRVGTELATMFAEPLRVGYFLTYQKL